MGVIHDNWRPTQEGIDALPLPVRRYLQYVTTECDPQHTIRESFLLKRENEFLRKECERLAALAGEGPQSNGSA